MMSRHRFFYFSLLYVQRRHKTRVSVQASAGCSSASYPSCQSLEDILRNLSSRQGPGKCVKVDLLDGDHSLTTPVFVNTTDLSLSIVGSTSSRVSCSFSSSKPTLPPSLRTEDCCYLVCKRYGCDRPIWLENIGYLHINNSTFR